MRLVAILSPPSPRGFPHELLGVALALFREQAQEQRVAVGEIVRAVLHARLPGAVELGDDCHLAPAQRRERDIELDGRALDAGHLAAAFGIRLPALPGAGTELFA